MEENESPSIKSIAIKWGAINGLLAIALLIVIDMSGLTGNQVVGWIGYLIFAVLVFLAHKEYKTGGDGFMSYGQGLGIGTLAMVVSSVISNVFFYIYISFINSGFIDAIKEQQIMDLEERGMSDAEIEQTMGFSEAFMTPIAMTIMGFVFTIFIGFIVSLIVSIFTKNTQPEEI